MESRMKSRILKTLPLVLLAFCVVYTIKLQLNSYNRSRSTFMGPEPTVPQDISRIEQQSIAEPTVSASDPDLENLSVKYDIAIPTPLEPWTDADLQLLQTAAGKSLLADLLTVPETIPDFKILTYQQRVFKTLFQFLDRAMVEKNVDVKTDPAYKDHWELYDLLETTLYPWLRPHWDNAFQINARSSGRGIVICVGNYHFKYAAIMIRTLRETLKSDMPIEVFYIRDDDLAENKRKYLETEFTNVRTRQVVHSINDWYTQFGGWAVKAYAILASDFSEVMLMDADVFFFKQPDALFNDEGYKKTGSLFFKDRTLFAGWDTGRNWLRSFLPTYSSLAENTRWWKMLSAHEQESGVVLIDKKKALFGLLATCKMNDRRERDEVTYKHVHGDKETFWIGFEMVQTPYTFVKSVGAVIGGKGDAGDEATVCGNIAHMGIDGRPLWWNGGLLRNKNKWSDRYMKFTHFAEGDDWEFETSCIKETDKIQTLTQEEHTIGQRFIEIDTQQKPDLELLENGLWKPSKSKR